MVESPATEVARAEEAAPFESRDPAFFFSKKEVRKNDLCVCMIGSEPENQQKWFKLGCSIWFSKQSCEQKRRIVQDETPGLAEILDESHRGSKVVLGFVGHWGSAHQTVNWLRDDLLPAASKYGVDLRIDNTACSGGDDPVELREGANKLLTRFPVPNLEVRVNQAISSGLWDPYLPGKNNFWIEFASQKADDERLTLPECRKFEGKTCWGWIQGGDSGFCQEEVKGRKQRSLLVCSKVDYETYMQRMGSTRSNNLERVTRQRFEWTRLDSSLAGMEIRESKRWHEPEMRVGLKNNRIYDEAFTEAAIEEFRDDARMMKKIQDDAKEWFFIGLPQEVHLDLGDDSMETKTISKSELSVDDVEIKEIKPRYATSSYSVILKQTKGVGGKKGVLTLGVYPTRELAEQARTRLNSNPFLLKHQE